MNTIDILYYFLNTYWIYLAAFYQAEKKQEKDINEFKLLNMLLLHILLAALFYELYWFFIYNIYCITPMPFLYVYFLSNFFATDVECIAYFCVIAITSSPATACQDLFGNWDKFIENFIIGVISTLIIYICMDLIYGIPLFQAVFFCKDPILGLLMASVIPIQAYWEEKLYRQVVHTMLDSIWRNIIRFFSHDNLENNVDNLAQFPYKMYINALLSGLYFATLHIPTFGTIPLMQYIMLLSVHWSMGCLWGIIYEETKNLGTSSGMHFMHNFWVITGYPVPLTLTGLRKQQPSDVTLTHVAIRYTIDALRTTVTYMVYKKTQDAIDPESDAQQDAPGNNILIAP